MQSDFPSTIVSPVLLATENTSSQDKQKKGKTILLDPGTLRSDFYPRKKIRHRCGDINSTCILKET